MYVHGLRVVLCGFGALCKFHHLLESETSLRKRTFLCALASRAKYQAVPQRLVKVGLKLAVCKESSQVRHVLGSQPSRELLAAVVKMKLLRS